MGPERRKGLDLEWRDMTLPSRALERGHGQGRVGPKQLPADEVAKPEARSPTVHLAAIHLGLVEEHVIVNDREARVAHQEIVSLAQLRKVRAIFVGKWSGQAMIRLIDHLPRPGIDGVKLERGAVQRATQFPQDATPIGGAEGRFVNPADQTVHLRFVAKHDRSPKEPPLSTKEKT